jgi:hypothetical protein
VVDQADDDAEKGDESASVSVTAVELGQAPPKRSKK